MTINSLKDLESMLLFCTAIFSCNCESCKLYCMLSSFLEFVADTDKGVHPSFFYTAVLTDFKLFST